MADDSDRVLSLLLNAEMDSLGFSKESVKRRVEMFKKRSKAKAAASRQILGCDHKEKIIVGSRREGIATATSDTDVLLIDHGILCTSDVIKLEMEESKVCLHLENEGAPAGYVFLSLYKKNGNDKKHFREIDRSTEYHNGKMYLSSEKYMDIIEEQQMTSRRGWFGKVVNIGRRKGPSIPKTIDALGFEADLVGAFTASCKHIISNWQTKERLHDWPSEETVDMATRLPLYVVAVGEHGCPDEKFLWRISFNNPEMALIHSMNDSQTKVLVMMKLLAKTLLTPVCPDITSYVIKNVVFHVLEQHPLQEFSREQLVHRLQDCLKYLRYCVENKCLPNYMNAERNLLQGKLASETGVSNVIHVIDDIIENGKEVFLFYLTNKTRPANIKDRYPRILPFRESLMNGYLEDTFAQKKVKAMTLDQLISLHVQADSCTSETMLFILELYYAYIPFCYKFGLKTLNSDLKKIRSQNQKANATVNMQDKGTTGEDFDETEIFNKEDEDHVVEDNEQEEVETPIQRDENVTEDHILAWKIWKYVTAVSYFLLVRCIKITKSTLFFLFEVVHLICATFTWLSLRDRLRDETVWLVDMIALSWIAVIGVVMIRKVIAQKFTLIYIPLLMYILQMMPYTDQYTLYLQELYVMLDPRRTMRNFRTEDLDMDDLDYFNDRQPMYA